MDRDKDSTESSSSQVGASLFAARTSKKEERKQRIHKARALLRTKKSQTPIQKNIAKTNDNNEDSSEIASQVDTSLCAARTSKKEERKQRIHKARALLRTKKSQTPIQKNIAKTIGNNEDSSEIASQVGTSLCAARTSKKEERKQRIHKARALLRTQNSQKWIQKRITKTTKLKDNKDISITAAQVGANFAAIRSPQKRGRKLRTIRACEANRSQESIDSSQRTPAESKKKKNFVYTRRSQESIDSSQRTPTEGKKKKNSVYTRRSQESIDSSQSTPTENIVPNLIQFSPSSAQDKTENTAKLSYNSEVFCEEKFQSQWRKEKENKKLQKFFKLKKFAKDKSEDYVYYPDETNNCELKKGSKTLNEFLMLKWSYVRKQLKKQLDCNIIGPTTMNIEEQKRRQLCRVPMHLKQNDQKKYYSITKVYQEAYEKFIESCGLSLTSSVRVRLVPAIDSSDECSSTAENSSDGEGSHMEIRDYEVEKRIDEARRRERYKKYKVRRYLDLIIRRRAKRGIRKGRWRQFLYIAPKKKSSCNSRGFFRSRKIWVAQLFPRHINESDLNQAMRDLYGDQIRNVDPDGSRKVRRLCKRISKARHCDQDCPPVNIEEAAHVHDAIVKHLDNVLMQTWDFELNDLEYAFGDTICSVKEWLNKYSHCFQGVRTLLRRYSELDHLKRALNKIRAVCKQPTNESMRNILKMEDLKYNLRQSFVEMFSPELDRSHHFTTAVTMNYGEIISKFRDAMENLENKPCDICGKYNVKIITRALPNCIHAMDDKTIEHFIRENVDTVDICDPCRKQLYVRKGSAKHSAAAIPCVALKNNMRPAEVPSVISCLNIIEKMLIEKARATQKIIHLHSITGRKTAMKATNGIVVIIPTDINATVNHVLKTLPSTSDMVIQVGTPWNRTYPVDVKNVLAALQWLKKNNLLYSDIKINNGFQIEDSETVVFEDDENNNNNSDSAENGSEDKGNEHENHLLIQVEEKAIKSVFPEKFTDLAHKRYVMQRRRVGPLPIATGKNYDSFIFPDLHPFGTDGMDADRKIPISFANYLRSRLLSTDRRWAQSHKWMCFMFSYKQQKQMLSIQGLQARVNVGTTKEEFDVTDDRIQKLIMSMFHKARGYPAYWKSVKFCLRSHIATFGNPTWYITLNPNITKWKDLHALYSTILQKHVDEDNIEEVISKDPVIFSRFWNRRVRKFFDNIVLSKTGPLGTVTHWFWRTEYQHKGTQHIHGMLWTADRPNVDASSKEHIDFINRYLTCRLPDRDEEPELHELVSVDQTHWQFHSKTCERQSKKTGVKTCRFGYPRNIMKQTRFDGNTFEYALPGVAKRPYQIARRENETMINDYNPTLLLAWNGNIDLQYIPSNVKDVVSYITAYTTKGEKLKRDENKEFEEHVLRGATKKHIIRHLLLKMLANREVGLLEIADDLLGHPLYVFDVGHVFIKTEPSCSRVRVLKDIKACYHPGDVVHVKNWYDNWYPSRDLRLFANCSLYNMMTNFDVITSRIDATRKRFRFPSPKSNGSDDDDSKDKDRFSSSEDEIQDEEEEESSSSGRYHNTSENSPFFAHPRLSIGKKLKIDNAYGKFMIKVKQRVGRFMLPQLTLNDPEIVEDYYRRLSFLFIPWTEENTFFDEFGVCTWSEVWNEFGEKLKQQDSDAFDDVENLLKGYSAVQKEEAQIAERLDYIREAVSKIDRDEEEQEHVEIQHRTVDSDEHRRKVENLNFEQKEIFHQVKSHIEAQEKLLSETEESLNSYDDENDAEKRDRSSGENENCKGNHEKTDKNQENKLSDEEYPNDGANAKMPEELRLFISGTAGTGKSHLINVIADEMALRYVANYGQGIQPAVLICAPTGIAALSIGGNTIHSLFRIEVVQENQRDVFSSVPEGAIDELRFLFEKVRLIIIDEISMVSNLTLTKIHMRLCEISGRTEPFGGYNVLLFGDILQLPPVKASHAFKELPAVSMRRVFQNIAAETDLWNMFVYKELVQNMRQGEDLVLAECLNRIRCNNQTDEDIVLLKNRRMPAEYKDSPSFEEMAQFLVHLRHLDCSAIALFAKNEEVEEMNKAVVKLIQLDAIEIEALDTLDDTTTAFFKRFGPGANVHPWMSVSIETDESGFVLQKKPGARRSHNELLNIRCGLPSTLTIAVGARVMLRKNISLVKKLVNGSTGVVTEIKRDSKGDPFEIEIIFDNNPGIKEKIRKSTVRYHLKDDEVILRTQFPLVLAYAATIHKAQGLTLSCVLICPSMIFAPGMFYVACSRVTSLNGLFFAGFDYKKIMANEEAVKEYNRRREQVGLPLITVTSQQNKDRSVSPQQSPDAPIIIRQKETDRKRREQRKLYDKRFVDSDIIEIMPFFYRLEKPAESGEWFYNCQKFHEVVAASCIHIIAMMEHAQSAVTAQFQYLNCSDAYKKVNLQNMDENTGSRKYMAVRECLLRKHNNFSIFSENFQTEVDAKKVFHSIMECLPETIRTMFERNYQIEYTCVKCKMNQFGNSFLPAIWLDEDGFANGEMNLLSTIKSYFDRDQEAKDRNCPCCGAVQLMKRKFGRGKKYLIVGRSDELPLEAGEVANVDGFKIEGDRFLLIGACKFPSKTNLMAPRDDGNVYDSTESTVFYRSPNHGWLKTIKNLSDQIHVEKLSKSELALMSMFVFVQKDKSRMKDEEKKRQNREDEEIIDDFVDIENFTNNRRDNLVQTFVKPSNATKGLLLKNKTTTDCFLNCAVNMLFACKSFRVRLVDHSSYRAVRGERHNTISELSRIFRGETDETATLRRTLGNCFQTGHQDASVILEHLFMIIARECSKLLHDFCYETLETRSCNSQFCFTLGENKLQFFYQVTVRDNLSTIESLINRNELKIRYRTCEQCQTAKSSKVINNVEATAQYFVVFLTYPTNDYRIKSEPKQGYTLFNSKWKLIAFAEYKAHMPHYVSWILDESGQNQENHVWRSYDDKRLGTTVSASQMELAKYSINFLVFSKA